MRNPIEKIRARLEELVGDKVGFATLWQEDLHGGTLTCYERYGKVFWLQQHATGGWDIYLPATQGNDALAEIETVAKYLAESTHPRRG